MIGSRVGTNESLRCVGGCGSEKGIRKQTMSELYNTEILRLTTQIPHLGRLEAPDVTAVKTSRVCGSRLSADACVQNGVITAFGQEVKACALGQASAALVGEQVIGLTEKELLVVAKKFRAMVKTGTADFPDKWHKLALLAPVKDHPGRHGSVMLPFDVLEQIFKEAGSSSESAA